MGVGESAGESQGKVLALVVTILGGFALLVPASAWFWTGTPKVWSPYPLFSVYPPLSGIDGHLAIWIPTLIFWLLGVRLFVGHGTLPIYSVGVFVLLALGDALWFADRWGSGAQYEGSTYVIGVASMNVVLCGILAGLARSGRRRPSYGTSYAFHWCLALWLGWCAFPWLGELP